MQNPEQTEDQTQAESARLWAKVLFFVLVCDIMMDMGS